MTQERLTEDYQYGAEVLPKEPVQDMHQIDHIVGGDAKSKDLSPGVFGGGTGGGGMGGQAEGTEEPAPIRP